MFVRERESHRLNVTENRIELNGMENEKNPKEAHRLSIGEMSSVSGFFLERGDVDSGTIVGVGVLEFEFLVVIVRFSLFLLLLLVVVVVFGV